MRRCDVEIAWRRSKLESTVLRTGAHWKRFCGGGPSPRAEELVRAICLSVLQREEEVERLLQQSWVSGWEGWKEFEEMPSDAAAMILAQRFLRIAGANVPVQLHSNAARLRKLEAEGFQLRVASSHGANNCLIDSLLLSLMWQGLSPRTYSQKDRKEACAECRSYLKTCYAVPLGIYLDGHRDTPRILDFFLRAQWAKDVSVRVFFYDCLSTSELGEAGQELSYVDFTWGDRCLYERHFLHVYNHVAPTGQGYHFDALLGTQVDGTRQNQTGGQRSDKPQGTTCRKVNPAKHDAFKASLLSKLCSSETVEARLLEEWVETWIGWEQLAMADQPEYEKLAADFCTAMRAQTRQREVEGVKTAASTATQVTQVRSNGEVTTYLDRRDAQRIVVACLFSKAGSWEKVTEILQQSWVSEWDGWQELQHNMTEEMSVRIAARLYAIAFRNRSASRKTNAMALQDLEVAGYRLERAQAFEMNNCLIDSITLCLCASDLLPRSLAADKPQRCHLTIRCRTALAKETGVVVQDTPSGEFPFLDAARDGPAVIQFLCKEFNISPLPQLVLRVHDRFNEVLEDTSRNTIQMPWNVPLPPWPALTIHLFHHTAENGQGYHFDSLHRKAAGAEERHVLREEAAEKHNFEGRHMSSEGWEQVEPRGASRTEVPHTELNHAHTCELHRQRCWNKRI